MCNSMSMPTCDNMECVWPYFNSHTWPLRKGLWLIDLRKEINTIYINFMLMGVNAILPCMMWTNKFIHVQSFWWWRMGLQFNWSITSAFDNSRFVFLTWTRLNKTGSVMTFPYRKSWGWQLHNATTKNVLQTFLLLIISPIRLDKSPLVSTIMSYNELRCWNKPNSRQWFKQEGHQDCMTVNSYTCWT